MRKGPTSHLPLHYDYYYRQTDTIKITTTMRSERFSTKLEQIHARNFLKEAVENALLANLKPFMKHLPNTCLLKNP